MGEHREIEATGLVCSFREPGQRSTQSQRATEVDLCILDARLRYNHSVLLRRAVWLHRCSWLRPAVTFRSSCPGSWLRLHGYPLWLNRYIFPVQVTLNEIQLSQHHRGLKRAVNTVSAMGRRAILDEESAKVSMTINTRTFIESGRKRVEAHDERLAREA